MTPYKFQVDCWSLGVLLYTLVYGSMPFDGRDFNRMIRQIKRGAYYEPDIPSSASMLIRSMLRVNPDRRADIDSIASHWWLNFSCDNLAPISDLPENQVLDPTPLIEREETMVVQKMLEDESDIFAEYSFINSSTRKKIEEFRRRRREAERSQDISEASVSTPAPRASRKRVGSKDRSVEPQARHRSGHHSGVRRPPTMERTESETFTDPLSRLRALEQRLDDMVTHARAPEHSHRPPRPKRKERSPSVKAKGPSGSQLATTATQRPLRVSDASTTIPIDPIASVPRERTISSSPDTQLANQLINDLLEESSKGGVSQTLIEKIQSSKVYDSKPIVKEVFNAVVGSTVKEESENIRNDDLYTGVASDTAPRKVSGSADRGALPQVSTSDEPPEPKDATATPLNQIQLGPRIYSGATTEPLPDIVRDNSQQKPTPRAQNAKLISASINVILSDVKPDVIGLPNALAAHAQPPGDIPEEDEDEEEENYDDDSAGEDEGSDEDLTDEEATDSTKTEEILKPLYSRLGEEETVHSVSDFEDLDVDDEEVANMEVAPMEPVSASDTESFASAVSTPHAPQVPSTAPACLTEQEEDNMFLRGLEKRQSRGKYERTKYNYARSISIEESPLMERRRIGGVQPQPEEADKLFQKAEKYILQFPDQPPTPNEEEKDTIPVTDPSNWLKTADPDLSNSSFECESPGNFGKKTPTPQDPAPSADTDKIDYYKVLWPPKPANSSEPNQPNADFRLMAPPPRKSKQGTKSTDGAQVPALASAEIGTSSKSTVPQSPEANVFQFPEGSNKSSSPSDTARDRDKADSFDSPSLSKYVADENASSYQRRRNRRPLSSTYDHKFDTAAKILTENEFVTRTPDPTSKYELPSSTGYGETSRYSRYHDESSLLSPRGLSDKKESIPSDIESNFRRHSYRSAVEPKLETPKSESTYTPTEPHYNYTSATHSRPLNDYMARRYDTSKYDVPSTTKYGETPRYNTDRYNTDSYDTGKHSGLLGYARSRYNTDLYRTGYFNRSTEEDHTSERKTAAGREKTKSMYDADYHYTPSRYLNKTTYDTKADLTSRSRSAHDMTPPDQRSDTHPDPVSPRRSKSKNTYDYEESPLRTAYRYNDYKADSDSAPRSTYSKYSGSGYERQTGRYGSAYGADIGSGYSGARTGAGTYRSRHDDNFSYRRSYYDTEPTDSEPERKDSGSRSYNHRYNRLMGRRRSKSLERTIEAASANSDTESKPSGETWARPSAYISYQYHDTATGSRDPSSYTSREPGTSAPARGILKTTRNTGSSEDDRYTPSRPMSPPPATTHDYSSTYGSKNYEAPSSAHRRTPLRFMDRLFARKTPESSRTTEGQSGGYDANKERATSPIDDSTASSRRKRNFLKSAKRSYSLGEEKYSRNPDGGARESTPTSSTPHSPLDKIKGIFSYNLYGRNKDNQTSAGSSKGATPERQQHRYQPTSSRTNYAANSTSSHGRDYRSSYKPITRFWYEDSSLY